MLQGGNLILIDIKNITYIEKSASMIVNIHCSRFHSNFQSKIHFNITVHPFWQETHYSNHYLPEYQKTDDQISSNVSIKGLTFPWLHDLMLMSWMRCVVVTSHLWYYEDYCLFYLLTKYTTSKLLFKPLQGADIVSRACTCNNKTEAKDAYMLWLKKSHHGPCS